MTDELKFVRLRGWNRLPCSSMKEVERFSTSWKAIHLADSQRKRRILNTLWK